MVRYLDLLIKFLLLPQFYSLIKADWKYRYAGLMTLSSTAEGCHKQMEQYLDQMVDGIVGFLKDPHPRVRYAACNCVGQMATDFAPTFQKKYHTKVMFNNN
jgi:hypothetical protein